MKKDRLMLSNVFYNTFGTFFYFFCQWLITVLIVRISGYHDAGVLSLIISTTNLFYCIALFGVRNYQISDINFIYSDNDYILCRLTTITLSLILFVISLYFLNFDKQTLMCSFVYIFYKIGEALSDVFFGCFQKHDSYKSIAVSYILKGIITLFSFVIIQIITQNLFITLLINLISYFLILLLYDLQKLRRISKLKFYKFNCLNLLKKCIPLLLYLCLVPYLNFITRYVIKIKFGIDTLGYYSSITMVFTVLSTLMNSVFVSIIPHITNLYEKKLKKELIIIIKKLSIIILIIGLFAIIAGNVFGSIVFSIIFGAKIQEYLYLLPSTIISAVALTYNSLYSSVLISMNERKKILYCDLAIIVLCTCILNFFVHQFELLGSIYTLILSLTLSSIIQLIIVFRKILVLNNGVS